MMLPVILSLVAFAAAIVWLIHLGRKGYDIAIDGLFVMMAAAIVVLVIWLIWALRR